MTSRRGPDDVTNRSNRPQIRLRIDRYPQKGLLTSLDDPTELRLMPGVPKTNWSPR